MRRNKSERISHCSLLLSVYFTTIVHSEEERERKLNLILEGSTGREERQWKSEACKWLKIGGQVHNSPTSTCNTCDFRIIVFFVKLELHWVEFYMHSDEELQRIPIQVVYLLSCSTSIPSQSVQCIQSDRMARYQCMDLARKQEIHWWTEWCHEL